MAATLITLAGFNGATGGQPRGDLIMDAAGNLFGTTSTGGPGGGGTVFELEKTTAGYASTPITLFSFDGHSGAKPFGSLIADAAGDLFGTTYEGGAHNEGTVFELQKTDTGYIHITLASFNGTDGAYPAGSLIMDAAGNLFGTTSEGGDEGLEIHSGTVFELKKTDTGYDSHPITLVNFGHGHGSFPTGSLIADTNGNLFGTTQQGGGGNFSGSVFELVKSGDSYTLTTLFSFPYPGVEGYNPAGSLIMDAAGNLFGTTSTGGPGGGGTVFELEKTTAGYASTPITLFSFDHNNGDSPTGSLIMDAAGNLFGTTSGGGTAPLAYADGTVFELQKTDSGYTHITLATFAVAASRDLSQPEGSLIADAAGDLFGTAFHSGNLDGGVFEITATGFVTAPSDPMLA